MNAARKEELLKRVSKIGLRTCLGCGVDFKPRRVWQKCCTVDCNVSRKSSAVQKLASATVEIKRLKRLLKEIRGSDARHQS